MREVMEKAGKVIVKFHIWNIQDLFGLRTRICRNRYMGRKLDKEREKYHDCHHRDHHMNRNDKKERERIKIEMKKIIIKFEILTSTERSDHCYRESKVLMSS
uniref:Uncharacterized protein LOC104230717 n=1 Tax=Nicotiana sylvestris TaxID=4096 RepID=A0A1U7WX63_NICSY|nr:PREDICTED: uncharacterized protein LOC104230717 [Nicotiana sylvestris]